MSDLLLDPQVWLIGASALILLNITLVHDRYLASLSIGGLFTGATTGIREQLLRMLVSPQAIDASLLVCITILFFCLATLIAYFLIRYNTSN